MQKCNKSDTKFVYVLGYEMVCEKCRVCMGRIPGEDFSYSDHMAVESTFQIRKNITGTIYKL